MLEYYQYISFFRSIDLSSFIEGPRKAFCMDIPRETLIYMKQKETPGTRGDQWKYGSVKASVSSCSRGDDRWCVCSFVRDEIFPDQFIELPGKRSVLAQQPTRCSNLHHRRMPLCTSVLRVRMCMYVCTWARVCIYTHAVMESRVCTRYMLR